MSDQARSLRAAVAQRPGTSRTRRAAEPPPLAAIAVTGGKGGVGKTSVAVNLALLLAKQSLRPLLVDFDLSLANADVMLGISAQTTLFDVVSGTATLAEAVVQAPAGLAFLPAASGRDELTRLSTAQLGTLFAGLAKAAAAYDLLVIDTAAGIGREVVAALRASRVVLVVVTPDPTSMTDAYALIKVLEAAQPGKDIRVLVNLASSQNEAMETYGRLRRVVERYLARDVALAGILPRDRAVADAVRQRRPFALGPDCAPAQALRALAVRIKSEKWTG